MRRGKICFFIVLLSMVVFMAGCGRGVQTYSGESGMLATEQNTAAKSEQTENTEKLEKTRQWNVLHSPLLETYEAATVDEDNIYACSYQENGILISVFAKDTTQQTATYEIPGVAELKSISVGATKEICVFGSTDTGDTLWKISPDGELSTIEDIVVEDLGKFAALKAFYTDSNGFYYLWYEMSVPSMEVYEDGEEDVYTALDRIYVKDRQMNTIVYEQVPDSRNNELVSIAFDEEGIPMLLAKDEEGYYVQQIRTVDREKYEISRLETEINESGNLAQSHTLAFTAKGLLYTYDGALYLQDLSNRQTEKLLELAVAGIWEEDIIYLGMQDDTIEIIDNYKGGGKSEYTAIAEGQNQRTQVTLGLMSLEQDMQEMLTDFNRYQNELTIEPIIYVDKTGGNYDVAGERLTLDIIQGKAPDLIYVDGLDSDILANIGAFADLYTLMQEDAELSEEDFVSNVLQVYESEGHLYTIGPVFRLYTMWGGESMVQGRKGIDVEEMMQMLEKNGGNINSIYGFSADESVLTTLCSFNMDKFINWNQGTCNFTGEEFQQVIRFAKEYEGTPYDSLYTAIRDKDLLLTLGIINSVEDYRLQSELYGERVEFIGYPTGTGIGSAVLMGNEIAINSQSAHQKEAWEFVKYMVQNGYHGTGFPLVKEQFEEVLNKSLSLELVEEDGQVAEVAKACYSEPNNVNIVVTKCEAEDVEAIRELVNNVTDKAEYHTEIQKIIEEEAAAYFHDQKSMEEVCKIIQNRVQLYLNEKCEK